MPLRKTLARGRKGPGGDGAKEWGKEGHVLAEDHAPKGQRNGSRLLLVL